MIEYSTLVIDDDIWMQRILSKTLQSYGFKKTYLASNGFDGIALAVEHKPHLIVLDILMPELSGHLTLKILKKIRTTQNIPVLMVSALSDVENLGLAVKTGTAGFISKPFTRATIYDKLLDVFGKDKLELVAKGEYSGELQPSEDFLKNNDTEDILKTKVTPKIQLPEKEKSGTKASIKQDQLLQHYQDDEKRSIESIKKMLLKSKK
ncbi:MAG: response regulator [Desulfobulbaceae bacterium]|nr:response regulator [Candidatus Kapabacteria bacterium]MBS3999453.1 response regulator [Desulfobulbaceae bacterium]